MAKITCEWARDNKVYVNENGNVYPCCYWHYNINIRDVINEEFITKYGNDVALGKYNLKTKTLHDILMSDFYQNQLKEHIESDKPCGVCVRQCTQ
mgnify:CR=1 FL=1